MSNPQDIEADGTPQSDAFNWIVNQDSAYICPEDPALITRYVMAVFYYSTRGNRWLECSAPSFFNSPEATRMANENCNIEPIAGSGSDAWLTPSEVCVWGGVVCNPLEAGIVVAIDMGE